MPKKIPEMRLFQEFQSRFWQFCPAMDRSKDKEKEDEKVDYKPVKYTSLKEMGLIDPDERLKALADYGTAIDIDHNIPPRRYYRSGVEMVRMANVYMEEGSLENAYILYMKFMTIFLERINKHPQYNTVSLKDRAMNQQKLREILPKAESLKSQLLAQYKTEQARYLADAKKREKIELERLKQEEEQRLKDEENMRNKSAVRAAARNANVIPSADSSASNSDIKKSVTDIRPISPIRDRKPDKTNIRETPEIDRSTKPQLLDGHELRDVVLPNKTMTDFLLLAFRNTTQNKETCGVLAGRLERNKLLVTHLLVPQQTGSPDSCTTHNEEDLFDYQDQHNLITLGWIHTHPTQTAFLSSVDLHTHCAYQLMMPEAIAVVCAPKYQDTGFYTLTPDYGLDFIANCRTSGFHPHPTQPPLYTVS
ncbi:STAM-binding protein isoform X2 [Athalia rosae]|uniref:STAM-binding protein isoform X2 n=1 Tax=Athalia rosae TaxID=37344 RepID=UPI002033432F|nr:STAM-binding protein isoform X2 [Athalia rosae]XP_048514634.1 STAM-binding protein isoform X2 [Athalia rosae]